MSKLFIRNKSTNWINNIDDLVDNYNNTPHSAIDDIKPNDAEKPENIYTIIEINLEKKKNNFQ